MKARSVLLIILIVVLVVAILWIAWMIFGIEMGNPAVSEPQSSAQSASSTAVFSVPDGKPSAIFPSDLPINENVQTLQSFQTNNPPQNLAISSFVAQEAVYAYVTTLSLNQAYTDYAKYFSSHSWKVLATNEQTGSQSISAENGSVSITAAFSASSTLQKNIVELTAAYYGLYFPSGTELEASATPQMAQQLQQKQSQQ
jgi:hypothetical protein